MITKIILEFIVVVVSTKIFYNFQENVYTSINFWNNFIWSNFIIANERIWHSINWDTMILRNILSNFISSYKAILTKWLFSIILWIHEQIMDDYKNNFEIYSSNVSIIIFVVFIKAIIIESVIDFVIANEIILKEFHLFIWMAVISLTEAISLS